MEIKKDISQKSYKLITRRKNGSIRVQTINEDPSLTDQSVAEDTDINAIMARYQKTKIWPGQPINPSLYQDVSNRPDLLTAATIVSESNAAFMELPSHIRLKFQNSPQALMSFLSNPQNTEEAVKLGLMSNTALKIKNDDLNDDKKSKAQKKSETTKNTEPQKPESE